MSSVTSRLEIAPKKPPIFDVSFLLDPNCNCLNPFYRIFAQFAIGNCLSSQKEQAVVCGKILSAVAQQDRIDFVLFYKRCQTGLVIAQIQLIDLGKIVKQEGGEAVGIGVSEDQQHRLTSSGISVPVGMKNPTSGDYKVMMNAISAAQNSHTFIYRGWQVHSDGNKHTHAILRGYTDQHGAMKPNYHYEDLVRLCDCYDEMKLDNPGLIVDTNHCNSNKNPFEQRRIIKEVLHSARHDERIAAILKGFMIESYIEDGAQEPGGGCYGKSITDPCLGWEKTEKLIYEIADLL